MKALILIFMSLTSFSSFGYLAHHWNDGTSTATSFYTLRPLTTGGTLNRFGLSGSNCVATDPDGNAFTMSSGTPMQLAGRSICRMALLYPAGTCVASTSNTLYCGGDINPSPANCPITGSIMTCN